MAIQNKRFRKAAADKESVASYRVWRVFFAILAIIFLVEAGVMFLLPLILPAGIDAHFEAIADAGLLSMGAAPLLWLAFIRPLQNAGLEKIAIIAAVAESASEGHLIFDGSGILRSANESASSIFGFPTDQIQQGSAFDLLPQELVDLCVADSSSRQSKKRPFSKGSQVLKQAYETTVRRKDGQLLAVQISLSVTHVLKSPVYLAVLQDIEERIQHEQELVDLNQQLLETSRRAGMSEIATGVLHNVGNVLNSINVSATLIREMLKAGHAEGLKQAVEMLSQHRGDLSGFFAQDSRGQQLVEYMASLSDTLRQEKTDSLEEIELLIECVDHVKEVVQMQQSYARVSGVKERFLLDEAIDDAMHINEAGLYRHGVEITRDYNDSAEVFAERHKVIQIMINLISNAKYAVSSTDDNDKTVAITIERLDDQLVIAVKDNGVGISSENISKIFSHGFTTKKDGHGFGLHSSILAAKEMDGTLAVESAGLGHGALFTLSLPAPATILEKELCLA